MYRFDFGVEHLPEGVTIDAYSFVVSVVRPRVVGGLPVLMEFDEDALTSDSRSVDLRLFGGTLGALYRIACHIDTNENPTQTKIKSFYLLIERQ